jgi:hypothetical protein
MFLSHFFLLLETQFFTMTNGAGINMLENIFVTQGLKFGFG